MNREEIIGKIDAFLVDEFEVEKTLIAPGKNLKETLDLDSLDYVDLVVEVESSFGFKVNPEDFKVIHTFDDFYSYVVEKVSDN